MAKRKRKEKSKPRLWIPEMFTQYEAPQIRKMIDPDYLEQVQQKLREKWPVVQKMEIPITGEQWISASTKYSLEELKVSMNAMERDVHRYGYHNAYLVLMKWCYNHRLDMTIEERERYTQELFDRYPSLRLKLLRHPNPNRYQTPSNEPGLFD